MPVPEQFANIPNFDDLPPVEGMPQGCAWGIFDKDGKKDHLGCINLLVPEVVQRAYKDCKDGESVSLNWPIGSLHTPGFKRKALEHKVLDFRTGPYDEKDKLTGFDDEITFNTQCASQWDSLVHVAHQCTGFSYNRTSPTVESLTQPFGSWDVEKSMPTLNHWHERGGLVGRAVLLDYRRWARAHGIEYQCFDGHIITVPDLEAIAKFQGTKFEFGDILIVRSGFTEDLSGTTAEEQAQLMGTHHYIGMENSVEVAKWVWDHHFAAVAGDMIGFERMPAIKADGTEGGFKDLVLHQYFLSMFGLNIGELWDLTALAKKCEEKNRWSFLITSIPLNVPGGVGSPPNALALF